MTVFTRVLGALLLLWLSAAIGAAAAEDLPERFAGEARIESQPSLPIHLELRRVGAAVEGSISMPIGSFEMTAIQEGHTITGRYEGPGGAGDMSLIIDGDTLTGTFGLGEAHGTISAQRTDLDAQRFFEPPEANLDLTTAQWLEDLDQLAEILSQKHGSPFHRISRPRFESEVAHVRAAIPQLDGTGIASEFVKLGALIGDGHTEVALPDDQARLPVELFWFEDGLRVIGIAADHQELLGARLIAVDAVAVEEVIDRLRPFIAAGETEWFVRAALPGLLRNPAILAAAGIVDGPSVALTLEVADGDRTQIEMTAKSEAGALAILNGAAPLWRRNETQGLWTEVLADGAVYVNWRSYAGLADAAAALLASLDAQHPPRLIVDLRDNTGGDYNAGRAFVEAIASRPWLNQRGTLYVLIGRATFSAAMTNAVDFMTMTNAILAGEPAGAAPNNWQEARRFNLPNSGLRVGVSTLHYEFLPGQAEVRPGLHVWPEPGDWGAPLDASVKLILSRP
ncbi:hypothetical protein VW23_018135 [Devosia insulae DS-56]|uniref:Tail specific protease domain-containing protein n=1 Tax=Devosia insulae DS-56 TaxID=1116389 RepID=A0A1E5XQX7_9HYPH|nr:hypothetical protein [Devosia insulae]OEO31011.1 hypothetical protein VW23_018135 [Devosia insulae DS-56]